MVTADARLLLSVPGPQVFRLFRLFIVLVLILLVPTAAGEDSTAGKSASRTDFVNAFFTDYDSTIPPNFDKGLSTNATVALYINNIDSVNEQTMDFTVNAFVTQQWHDHRLAFEGLISDDYLEMDSKLMQKFWVPDLYFSNEKSASFHSITVPNRMLHLYRNGTVVYKIRISVTATCPMKLQKYPMDEQTCTLFLRSFAFSENYLQFSWRTHSPMQWNIQMVLPQFRLVDLRPVNCSSSQHDNFFDGFTCIAANFYLKRNLGYYMITIYIPSVLIVMLSWVSFWLPVESVPARVTLGILTVLTMTTQTSVAVSSLPKVSYVKALDIWMATCLCFVFASLLEYALVNVLERKNNRKPPLEACAQAAEQLRLQDRKADNGCTRSRLLARRQAQTVDNISRCSFPTVFTIFCSLYFLVFSS